MINNTHKIVPDPNMMDSVSNAGYNLRTACADLIDNTMDINSPFCKVIIESDKILFIDNGCGMDEKGLVDAVVLGRSNKPASQRGRFGLGLKASARYLGNEFRVISNSGQGALVVVPHYENWTCKVTSLNSDDQKLYDKYLKGKTGTIIEIKDLRKDWATILSQRSAASETRRFLGRIFRRFLTNFDLTINSKEVKAIDPLHDPKTIWFEKEYKVKYLDRKTKVPGIADVSVKIVELPRHRSDLDDCGICLMRNGREISSGQTLGFFRRSSEFGTLRAEISFPGELDNMFDVDFKKSGHDMDIDWVSLNEIKTDFIAKIAEFKEKALKDIEAEQNAEILNMFNEIMKELMGISGFERPTIPRLAGVSGAHNPNPTPRNLKNHNIIDIKNLGENEVPWVCEYVVEDMKITLNADTEYFKKYLKGSSKETKKLALFNVISQSAAYLKTTQETTSTIDSNRISYLKNLEQLARRIN